VHSSGRFTYVESLLLLTAFAASAVDVIGFGQLGRVFASAMTGNFALLAFHTAEHAWSSVAGASIALCGFITGCVGGYALRRNRSPQHALTVLLACELALLTVFAVYVLWSAHTGNRASVQLQILMLAIAMGLQSVIGQIISLTTIVFTTTLTRLVGNFVDLMCGHREQVREMWVQGSVVICYLGGALLSAVLVIRHVPAVVLLPLLGVILALLSQQWAARRAVSRAETNRV
jgi:uncharacterized membrane protein YoaK (UPF0700 family)